MGISLSPSWQWMMVMSHSFRRGNVVYGLKNGYEIINQGLSPSIMLKWKRLFAFRIIHTNKTAAITVPG